MCAYWGDKISVSVPIYTNFLLAWPCRISYSKERTCLNPIQYVARSKSVYLGGKGIAAEGLEGSSAKTTLTYVVFQSIVKMQDAVGADYGSSISTSLTDSRQWTPGKRGSTLLHAYMGRKGHTY